MFPKWFFHSPAAIDGVLCDIYGDIYCSLVWLWKATKYMYSSTLINAALIDFGNLASVKQAENTTLAYFNFKEGLCRKYLAVYQLDVSLSSPANVWY